MTLVSLLISKLNESPVLRERGWGEHEAKLILKHGPDSDDAKLQIAMKRSQGEPLQYLLGTQQFLDLELEVGPGVLVPRPETECLVLHALDELKRQPVRMGLEIGLGSGAISLSMIIALRKKNPDFMMLATELSEEAFVYALRNATRVLQNSEGLETVKVESASDVLDTLARVMNNPATDWPAKADFLISNPPYLVSSDTIDLDVRTHEPNAALFAPEHDPNFFYRAIASGAAEILKPGAPVFVEVPSFRAEEIRTCFENLGWDVTLRNDLAGEPRVLVARLRKAQH